MFTRAICYSDGRVKVHQPPLLCFPLFPTHFSVHCYPFVLGTAVREFYFRAVEVCVCVCSFSFVSEMLSLGCLLSFISFCIIFHSTFAPALAETFTWRDVPPQKSSFPVLPMIKIPLNFQLDSSHIPQ